MGETLSEGFQLANALELEVHLDGGKLLPNLDHVVLAKGSTRDGDNTMGVRRDSGERDERRHDVDASPKWPQAGHPCETVVRSQ